MTTEGPGLFLKCLSKDNPNPTASVHGRALGMCVLKLLGGPGVRMGFRAQRDVMGPQTTSLSCRAMAAVRSQVFLDRVCVFPGVPSQRVKVRPVPHSDTFSALERSLHKGAKRLSEMFKESLLCGCICMNHYPIVYSLISVYS